MTKKLLLSDFQKIAEKSGGVCLSSEYKNSKTKLTFRCSKNHTWDALPPKIKFGQWCPQCSGNTKLTIDTPAPNSFGIFASNLQLFTLAILERGQPIKCENSRKFFFKYRINKLIKILYLNIFYFRYLSDMRQISQI